MTGRKTPTRPSAEIVNLNATSLQPHPERLNQIVHWHIDRAAQRDTVALLHIRITSGGFVCTDGVAIEPEHAALMLGELAGLMRKLECAADGPRARSETFKTR